MSEGTPVWINSEGGPKYAMVGRAVWGQAPFVQERGDDALLWECQDCKTVIVDWKGHNARWHEGPR